MLRNLNDPLNVHGIPCYMTDQCRFARTDASKTHELWAIRYAARYGYTWPGGYAIVAITDDGECLCSDCVRDNYRQIFRSTTNGDGDGWQVTGATNTAELDSTAFCAHCGKEIS